MHAREKPLVAKHFFVKTKNREFLELMAAAGWSQAEVARQLEITSGGVSQIARGHVTPSPVTLRLLRLLVHGTTAASEGAGTVPAYAQGLIRALEEIEPEMREVVIDTALRLAKAYKKRPSSKPGVRETAPVRYTEPVRNDVRLNTDVPPYRPGSPPVTDPLPGVSAKVADMARGGALAAQRLARKERQRKDTAASPSGSRSSPDRGAAPAKRPPPATPAPAPR
jgi:transcriptional regulator with XRE-family HTH domain